MRLDPLVLFLVAAVAAAEQLPPPPSEEKPRPPQEEPTPPARLLVKGFADIDFEWRGDDVPSRFALGELDVFATAELAEELSFLAEVVFEPSGDDEFAIDVERVQVKFSPSDRLNLVLGRIHTPLGYWNQTFHHGTWFQTTAFRPQVYRFEDQGGPLPVHEVGLQLLGAGSLPGLRLEYSLSVSNGRGSTPAEVQTFGDSNKGKVVNLWLGLSARAVPGLEWGGVARLDSIPPDPASPDRGGELDERILGGFAVYVSRRAELLAEMLQVRHEDPALDRAWNTLGLYVQGAWRFGRFKSYYRFDLLDYGAGDPFYGPEANDLRMHTLGLRIDPWAWAALKLELSRHGPDPGASFTAAAFQMALTF